jgi:hypothetical protein
MVLTKELSGIITTLLFIKNSNYSMQSAAVFLLNNKKLAFKPLRD